MNGSQDIDNGPDEDPTGNWYYGKVYINRHTFKDPDLCGASSRRAPIVAHEMGHVMGLAHASGGSIMTASISSSTISTVTRTARTESMRSTEQVLSSRLRTALAASLGTAILGGALTGCSASSSPDVDHPPAQGAGNPTKDDATFATVEIGGDASLVAPFALPTLTQFLLSPVVANIVVGTIESSQVHVDKTEGGHDVFTVSQVVVESSAIPTDKVIPFTTLGGTVPLREVRSDFEGRPEQPDLSAVDLDKLVTYRANGASEPRAGEQVLIVLTDDGGTLLDLVLSRGQYEWRGKEAPNPAWTNAISPAEVANVVATLKRKLRWL